MDNEYIKLDEYGGGPLYIRKDSLVWIREVDKGSNIGLGSSPAGVWATVVNETPDRIFNMLRGLKNG